MAVRLRMKKMGRKHRHFFRICAMDSRTPRDGRVIEELGTYDPMIPDTNARCVLKTERVDYWLGVGAKPTPKVGVLIRKYGTSGTHVDEQKAALDQLDQKRTRSLPPAPTAGGESSAPLESAKPQREEPAAEATEDTSPKPEAPPEDAPKE